MNNDYAQPQPSQIKFIPMHELIELTKQWFLDKGLTGPNGKGTLAAQAKKNLEEGGEIIEAVAQLGCWPGKPSELELKKEIGDNFVTAIGLCELLGTTPEECLQLAYDKISNRKGTIVNNQFVKES